MGEGEVIRGLKSGDPQALAKLVELYGERLLRSAYLLCGNEADAQDLVQDTLIQASKSARWFRGKSTLYTWLHGILLNLSHHYYRKRKRIIYTDKLPQPKTPALSSVNVLDMREASAILADALQQLSQAHREAIILRYYEGMKIGEIARLTGTSKGTVKSRLHYATKQLRALIPKELNLFKL